MTLLIPSYKQGFARNAAESENPNLWKGLVGLWAPSLGPTGLTLYDQSGYRNDGTLTNMTPSNDWVVTEKGWALDFDGINDYGKADDLGEDRDGSFSVAMLLKPADIATDSDVVLGRGYPVAFAGWCLWQRGSRLDWLIPNVAKNDWLANQDCRTGVLANGTWYHIVFVKSGNELSCFQDGIEVDSFSMASAAIGDASTDFFIGSGCTAASFARKWWEGQMAFVGVWNRALSPFEVQQLYVDPHAMLRPRRRVYAVAGFIPYPHPLLNNMSGGMAT